MKFFFANQVLDTDTRELSRENMPVSLEPQVFDLVVHLMENRDRVVSKEELITKIWHGRHVAESTLTSRINAARKAVGDSGSEQALIRTIARKGFRFVGDLKEASAQNVTKSAAIDLGGIAKGYAADAAMRILKQHRIRQALVAAGRNRDAVALAERMEADGAGRVDPLWLATAKLVRGTEQPAPLEGAQKSDEPEDAERTRPRRPSRLPPCEADEDRAGHRRREFGHHGPACRQPDHEGPHRAAHRRRRLIQSDRAVERRHQTARRQRMAYSVAGPSTRVTALTSRLQRLRSESRCRRPSGVIR